MAFWPGRAQVVDVEEPHAREHARMASFSSRAAGRQRLVARQAPHVGVEGGELEGERARVGLVEQQQIEHGRELERCRGSGGGR